MQENVKIANAMIKMKSTYDIKSYNKDYKENLSKYRNIIQRYKKEEVSSL